MLNTTNTRPSVSISPPEADRILFWADYIDDRGTFFEVPFTSTVQDAEDGALTGNKLQWYYREIGDASWRLLTTGSSPTLQLPIVSPEVSYEIRLTAVDSGGLTGEDSTTIMMVGPPN